MRASGYAREKNDFYCEPAWVVDALLDVEQFSGVTCDPACGTGNIPNRLRARGLHAWGSDLVDRGDPSVHVADFMTEFGSRVNNIVSNPPYGILEPFIRRALTFASSKVAVLARLAFLEGQARRSFFDELPFARVWVSSRRVSMPPGNSGVKASGGTIAFAWFVFEHGHVGTATVGHI